MIKLPSNTATYFPAAGPQFESTYWKQEYNYNGVRSIKWFSGDSFFHYPYMLTNAFNNIGTENYRSYHGFPVDPEHILIGDSGGFQIVSYAKRGNPIDIEPIKILRWLETNCDIGMNLDVPLLDKFDHSLSKSLENFKMFQNSRKNYDMILCNVLHGRNQKELITWFNSVKDFDFDGWAIGVKPATNTYLQLYAYLLLHENGAKGLENYCHFFGVSNLRVMVMLAMLFDRLEMPIGFDSSGYNIGSTAREFFMPKNMIKHYSMGSKKSSRSFKGMACDCPVCRTISIDDIYEDSGRSGALICLHNLYVTAEVNRVINCLVPDADNLNLYVSTMLGNDDQIVHNVDQMLLDYKENGSDYVYRKYQELFIEKSDPIVSRNLANFV